MYDTNEGLTTVSDPKFIGSELQYTDTLTFPGVLSADYCYNGYHFKTYYCEYGCCGSGLDQYCCAYSLAALIAGCVVGVLILIAFLVFVWLYYLKRKKQAGRVIAPGTTTTTTTVAVVNGATLPSKYMYRIIFGLTQV